MDYARFCEKHDLHLVSDEIYALSTYENPSEEMPEAMLMQISPMHLAS